MKGAMSMNQPDTAAGKHHPDRPPDFRVVLRGYDRAEVDEYLPQLMARLSEAVDRYAQAEQARAELEREIRSLREGSFQQLGGDAAVVLQEAGRSGEQLVERARQRADNIVHKAQTQAEQLRAEVTSEAQGALAQARQLADQIRQETEQERAALRIEREQVRELHDGLLADLRRVHGEISGLLARTDTSSAQALTAADPEPKAASARNGQAERPAGPGTVADHQ
jgi:DivIVA domain-containing protein